MSDNFAGDDYIEVSRVTGTVDVWSGGVVTSGTVPAGEGFVTVEVVSSVELVGSNGKRMNLTFVTPDDLDNTISIAFSTTPSPLQQSADAELKKASRQDYATAVLKQ